MSAFQPPGHLRVRRAVENVAGRYNEDAVKRYYDNFLRVQELGKEEHEGTISEAGMAELKNLLAQLELANFTLCRVEDIVHSALMHGDLTALELRRDSGELLPVPASSWRVDGAENELRGARDYRSPFKGTVFLEVAALDRLFAPDAAVRTVSDEKRLADWLTALMRSSPNVPRAKPAVRAEAKENARLSFSARGFERAWIKAVKASGAHTWSKAGRKSKRRIETPT